MRWQALSIALLAFALGLFAGPVAEAGCAGPLLTVMNASFEPVPPDSSDPSAEPTYHVRAGQQVTVQASNLGLCSDTDVVIGGCAAGRPQQRPTASPVPVRNVALHLEQGSRRLDLGLADATAPDYTIDYPVELPWDLKPGYATLRLTGPTLEGDVSVRLQVS